MIILFPVQLARHVKAVEHSVRFYSANRLKNEIKEEMASKGTGVNYSHFTRPVHEPVSRSFSHLSPGSVTSGQTTDVLERAECIPR